MTIGGWILALIIIQILHFLGTYKLYVAAGRKPWEAAIPVYSAMVFAKIIHRPMWWGLLLFIPIIGPIMLVVFWVDGVRCFDKRDLKSQLLVVLTLGFYFYYLSYVEKPAYTGPEKRKETLISAILYGVVVATFFHTFVVQPFVIPTSSMEKTLRVGDFMLVSKLSYGPRVPITPIAIPFLNNEIPFTEIKPYVSWISLPYFRLFKGDSVKQNEIVVFNFPTDSLHKAIDRKSPYVKRCVAIAGDSLYIDKAILYVNGKKSILPVAAEPQLSYVVYAKEELNLKYLREKLDIFDIFTPYGPCFDPESYPEVPGAYVYGVHTTEQTINQIKKWQDVISVKPFICPKNISEKGYIFPTDKPYNRDFYGPIYVPKKGDILQINQQNIAQYTDLIGRYEGHDLKIENNLIYIDGKPSKTYQVNQNYYFMMGDNRHNSLDSRYFGYVPEDHIIGRPIFTWMSMEWRDGVKKLRPERIMTVLNETKTKKTSYKYLAIGLLVAYWVYSLIRGRKNKAKKDV